MRTHAQWVVGELGMRNDVKMTDGRWNLSTAKLLYKKNAFFYLTWIPIARISPPRRRDGRHPEARLKIEEEREYKAEVRA